MRSQLALAGEDIDAYIQAWIWTLACPTSGGTTQPQFVGGFTNLKFQISSNNIGKSSCPVQAYLHWLQKEKWIAGVHRSEQLDLTSLNVLDLGKPKAIKRLHLKKLLVSIQVVA